MLLVFDGKNRCGRAALRPRVSSFIARARVHVVTRTGSGQGVLRVQGGHLFLLGAGLMIFGVYGLAEARWRRVPGSGA